MKGSPPVPIPGRGVVLLALIVVLTPPPHGAHAQDVRERTPNLAGSWIGEPGTLRFHFLHRFWVVQETLVNSPTLELTIPVSRHLVAGTRYGSNARIVPGRPNEWEGFVRWVPLGDPEGGHSLALTGAWNSAARSVDGAVNLTLERGPLRLLGTGRGFTDAAGSGSAGWGVAGGIVLRIRPNAALAGDYGVVRVDGNRGRSAWGAALQLGIPATPHSLSLQVTNTPTATLHGSSFPRRTTWGFEFTVPITLARYFR